MRLPTNRGVRWHPLRSRKLRSRWHFKGPARGMAWNARNELPYPHEPPALPLTRAGKKSWKKLSRRVPAQMLSPVLLAAAAFDQDQRGAHITRESVATCQ